MAETDSVQREVGFLLLLLLLLLPPAAPAPNLFMFNFCGQVEGLVEERLRLEEKVEEYKQRINRCRSQQVRTTRHYLLLTSSLLDLMLL